MSCTLLNWFIICCHGSAAVNRLASPKWQWTVSCAYCVVIIHEHEHISKGTVVRTYAVLFVDMVPGQPLDLT
jgi:hypothetical protein